MNDEVSLFIGGFADGFRMGVPEGSIYIFVPEYRSSGTVEHTYRLHRLVCGKQDFYIYKHESLEDHEVLERLISHYEKDL